MFLFWSFSNIICHLARDDIVLRTFVCLSECESAYMCEGEKCIFCNVKTLTLEGKMLLLLLLLVLL